MDPSPWGLRLGIWDQALHWGPEHGRVNAGVDAPILRSWTRKRGRRGGGGQPMGPSVSSGRDRAGRVGVAEAPGTRAVLGSVVVDESQDTRPRKGHCSELVAALLSTRPPTPQVTGSQDLPAPMSPSLGLCPEITTDHRVVTVPPLRLGEACVPPAPTSLSWLHCTRPSPGPDPADLCQLPAVPPPCRHWEWRPRGEQGVLWAPRLGRTACPPE